MLLRQTLERELESYYSDLATTSLSLMPDDGRIIKSASTTRSDRTARPSDIKAPVLVRRQHDGKESISSYATGKTSKTSSSASESYTGRTNTTEGTPDPCIPARAGGLGARLGAMPCPCALGFRDGGPRIPAKDTTHEARRAGRVLWAPRLIKSGPPITPEATCRRSQRTITMTGTQWET